METRNDSQDWMQVAEIEIIYKPRLIPAQRPQVKSSHEIYQILLAVWNQNRIWLQEECKVLLLNRRNRILGVYDASSGGTAGVIVDPKLMLAAALKAGASSLIMAHNHPSGETSPSNADIQLTQRIKQCAALLDLRLLDHLIITVDGYFSFSDDGLI